VNKVCLSGLNALYLADQMVAAGDADIVVAGGMESMTNAPYLADGARGGFRYGNAELRDAIIADGLWCAFDACLMGLGTERYAAGSISREAQDELAAASHERAANAIKDGRFADEIAPVSIPQRKGEPVVVSRDEAVRPDTTPEALAKLPAVTKDKGGMITAGNAPGLNDGAAALVLMSGAHLKERNAVPIARVVAYATGGGEPRDLFFAPIDAVQRLMKKMGVTIGHFDLIEANEAFAAQAVADGKALGWDWSRVNVNGGAVALGHPIGASGARVLVTLLSALEQRGKKTGLATLCLGGGNAVALAVERIG